MKVMLVNGSSHLHGTTMAALEEMIKVFHSEEVETEVVQLGGKPIADCLQCNVCQKTGKCVIKDDGVNEFVEKAKTADGFVFATPVYFAHPSGRLYDFLDRAFYSAGGYDAFKFKPGAAVAVARRGGTTAVLMESINILGLRRCQSSVLPIGTRCMDFMERKRLRMKKVCRLCGILHET